MVQTVTTWDDPRIGYGSIQIQVQNAYNDFRQQTHSYQEHIGGVNTSTTPKVQYSYTNDTGNTIRMLGMTYPSGRVVSMNYGTANDMVPDLSVPCSSRKKAWKDAWNCDLEEFDHFTQTDS